MAEQDPDVAQEQTQQPSSSFSDIANQWTSFLGQPGASQFMLGMGINLMQPRSFGDTPASQIGRAIGHGAEAATTSELVGGKLGEMEARSTAAVARAESAGKSLGMDYFRQQALNERQARALQQQLLKAHGAELKNYETAVKNYEQRKANFELTAPKGATFTEQPPPAPERDFETWVRSKGFSGFLTSPGGSSNIEGLPPGSLPAGGRIYQGRIYVKKPGTAGDKREDWEDKGPAPGR